MRRALLLLSIPLLLVGAAGTITGKEPEHKSDSKKSDGKKSDSKSDSKKSDSKKSDSKSDSKKSDSSSKKSDSKKSDSKKSDGKRSDSKKGDSKKSDGKRDGGKGRQADRKQDKGKGKRREPEPPPRDPALDTEPRVVQNPNDPREVRIAELRGHLDDVLREHPLSRTRIGVAVMDARDGDILYAHNADKLFNPASNTKIVSTAAALSELGSDYRFVTRILGPAPDGEGVVHGDIELRGSGDPSLSTQGVADLARDLAARGVTRVEGDLIADGKLRDAEHPAEAMGGGAIIMNRNVYTVHVSPGDSGKNAYVTVEPRGDGFFGASSKVTTVSKKKRKTRISLDGFREGGRFIVVAKGRVNIHDEYKKKERLGDGTPWALWVLRRALGDFGIELTGKTRSGSLATPPKESRDSKSGKSKSAKAKAAESDPAGALPTGDVVAAAGSLPPLSSSSAPGPAPGPGEPPLPATLAEHRSAPLGEICRVSNKDSNNFVADSIFKTLGRERFGGVASMEKGARAVKEMLTALGFDPASYHFINGSGLTHENRIQPSALTRLLRHLYFDLAVSPEFVTSLAIGGIDGTIKGRFRGGDFLGKVRAKTGTLSNVSALSGYVGDHGDVLIFAILVDDFHHRRLEDIRDAQVRLVKQLESYLRAGRPAAAPRPGEVEPGAVPGEPGDAPPDDEPDEDSDAEADDGPSEPGGN